MRGKGRKAASAAYAVLSVVLIGILIARTLSDPGSAAVVLDKSADAAAKYNVVSYIKYVDFNIPAGALKAAAKYDVETYNSERHISWITLLALAADKYYGEWKNYKSADLDYLAKKLTDGAPASELAKSQKLYDYYLEAYDAVLGGLIGEYTDSEYGTARYGVRAFSPFAYGYYYNDFDDFGVSRSFGYRREHLGHDMLGSVGTPIIAVESGYVEACGWNMYGGWRIGIRSFDGKRYYYYAHLRRNHPYNDIYEGKTVNAGEVIGYLGMTGYSAKENVNNIDTPHLHFGLELIFDPSQKDGYNQIWVDVYALTAFLSPYRSRVYKNEKANEYYAENYLLYPDIPD